MDGEKLMALKGIKLISLYANAQTAWFWVNNITAPTFLIEKGHSDLGKLVWQACFLSQNDKGGLIGKLSHIELGLKKKLSFYPLKISNIGLLIHFL